jgi:hypothetical protein
VQEDSADRRSVSLAADSVLASMSFTLRLGTDDGHTGSAEGAQNGVNPVMDAVMRRLRSQTEQIRNYASTMRSQEPDAAAASARR